MNSSGVYNCSMYGPSFAGNHVKYLQKFMDSPVKKVLKQECINSVSGLEQFEKAIVVNVKNNKVISKVDGTLTDVPINIPKSLIISKNYTVLHSHPTLIDSKGQKYSLPLSFGDFEVLVNNKNLKEIVAINQNGRETILQKTDDYKTLSKEQIAEIRNKYFETIYTNLCNEEEKQKILSLYEYVQLHPNSVTIKQSIVDKLLAKQYSQQAGSVIKEFFKNISESLNLKFIEK